MLGKTSQGEISLASSTTEILPMPANETVQVGITRSMINEGKEVF